MSPALCSWTPSGLTQWTLLKTFWSIFLSVPTDRLFYGPGVRVDAGPLTSTHRHTHALRRFSLRRPSALLIAGPSFAAVVLADAVCPDNQTGYSYAAGCPGGSVTPPPPHSPLAAGHHTVQRPVPPKPLPLHSPGPSRQPPVTPNSPIDRRAAAHLLAGHAQRPVTRCARPSPLSHRPWLATH